MLVFDYFKKKPAETGVDCRMPGHEGDYYIITKMMIRIYRDNLTHFETRENTPPSFFVFIPIVGVMYTKEKAKSVVGTKQTIV